MSDSMDRLAIKTIQGLAMDAVESANSGHPGTPMALAPLGQVLFRYLLRHDPSRPDWPGRDRFVLSCGHASMLQYALLHLHGYPLSLADIKAFRQWDSLTPGHPEYRHTSGVEITTGPLGAGVSSAVGMAMAARHLSERFDVVDGKRSSEPLFEQRVLVIASDGDLMEGVSAESASLAGHLKLGNLVVFWDDNRITIDGPTDLAFTEDVCARYRAYGWKVREVEDGSDVEELRRVGEAALEDAQPTFVRVRTVIGAPAPTKQGTAAAHGAPLGADEVAGAKAAMDWPAEPFHIPADLANLAPMTRARGAAFSLAWDTRYSLRRAETPELCAELDRVLGGELPEGWDQGLDAIAKVGDKVATRKANAACMAAIAPKLPELVGGSADLTGSNGAWQPGRAIFAPTQVPGEAPANVHFGVREHGMGSILNGMALFGGVRPYGATFLVFSDYMRPAIRLAALMKLPVRFLFTHDSIGLGEDGPTHQPVEHLACLRAIPGLTVWRPADALETAEVWRNAVAEPGPSALVLSRQGLPVLEESQRSARKGVPQGAYLLREVAGSDPSARPVTLFASGSEVALAVAVADKLQGRERTLRVVSVPSLDRFLEQDPARRSQLVGSREGYRMVIEAGLRQGWELALGADCSFTTMESFGASAPAEELFKHFGFDADAIAERIGAELCSD